MEKVKVHISWLNNYGACCDLVPGCIATHKTLEGVKQGFREALEWHLAAMKEDGDDIPEALQGDYELHFALDAQALLHHYDGILTRSAISRLTGINQKQLAITCKASAIRARSSGHASSRGCISWARN